MWVLFCVLSLEMRHINYFLGSQNRVFWVGAEKFVEKVGIRLICCQHFGNKKSHVSQFYSTNGPPKSVPKFVAIFAHFLFGAIFALFCSPLNSSSLPHKGQIMRFFF